MGTHAGTIEEYARGGIALAGAIDVQQDAVVSKTLINKNAGTITLFAFDAGQGLSEHTAPFDAFVYVVEGTVEITIAGSAHSISAGEMIIMPAGKPHALRAVSAFKMLLVMVKG